MKCPKCKKELEEIDIEVEDAETKMKSWQCDKCDYIKFDKASLQKVIDEIKAKEALNLKQNVIKLSQDRLGIYLSKDIIRCLDLEAGQEVLISVPDKKHILLSLQDVGNRKRH